ncbi:MAG: RIP metalloprotease RseP, partial [Sinobacterium sp.]|nr:RIP metalloprotease RseP [Sinobacterium sp.]
PIVKPVINEVMAQSAASKAGLQVGDTLKAADGEPINDWIAWVEYVQARPNALIELDYERDGQLLHVQITPQSVEYKGKSIGRVGVGVAWPEMPENLLVHTPYNLLTAWLPALDRTWQTAKFSLVSIKKMILGQISYKQLSGPITIAKVATQSAQSGIYSYLSLLALLSVSLGVLNLLPIPVLDGGHIFFYIIEWLKGSPVPESIQAKAFQLGLSVVLAVMVLAFVNDISRL